MQPSEKYAIADMFNTTMPLQKHPIRPKHIKSCVAERMYTFSEAGSLPIPIHVQNAVELRFKAEVQIDNFFLKPSP